MFVTKVTLTNFRNYATCQIGLQPGSNIFIGENAQGKSNLLEAIELLATSRSARADQDADLMRWGTSNFSAEVDYRTSAGDESLRLRMAKVVAPGTVRGSKLEKNIAVNGVTQKTMSDLLGRLLIVSFSANDLNLLRGGPKFRRDWLDSLIFKLRPSFEDTFADFRKTIAQRNRLLKSIFERGKVTVTDQDQLLVWDKQTARFGAKIIKQRLSILSQVLPLAEQHQSRISRQSEQLSIRYLFKASDSTGSDSSDDEAEAEAAPSTAPLSAAQLADMDEIELAKTLMRMLKERRAEEIRRKQTTVGPHRDDLIFCLNDADAVSFASQGQQRSIVLALKLGELGLIKATMNESPVLLLDDVLAELDEFRQALLMSVVQASTQTIITTTHVTGFDPKWLYEAALYKVHDGTVERSDLAAAVESP